MNETRGWSAIATGDDCRMRLKSRVDLIRFHLEREFFRESWRASPYFSAEPKSVKGLFDLGHRTVNPLAYAFTGSKSCPAHHS